MLSSSVQAIGPIHQCEAAGEGNQNTLCPTAKAHQDCAAADPTQLQCGALRLRWEREAAPVEGKVNRCCTTSSTVRGKFSLSSGACSKVRTELSLNPVDQRCDIVPRAEVTPDVKVLK